MRWEDQLHLKQLQQRREAEEHVRKLSERHNFVKYGLEPPQEGRSAKWYETVIGADYYSSSSSDNFPSWENVVKLTFGESPEPEPDGVTLEELFEENE
jgi:hypothetical protein